MNNFNFYNPSKIIFGKDSINELPKELEKRNIKNILLMIGGEYIKKLGIYDKVISICEDLNINYFICNRVSTNPKIELVREYTNLAKKENIDFILAIGGGSTIDASKAIAFSAKSDLDPWDFFSENHNIESAIEIGVISTIPASGSETSNATIISNGKYKLGVEDNLIIPKFAILDPSYTINLPLHYTVAGIADILSHLFERYFTNTQNVDTTDYLIEGAIKSLLLNAKRVIKDPKNYDARAEIQWVGTIAHNNLLDTGRQTDWGSHRIEHELSGEYNISHGEGMAIIFLAWIKYASAINPNKIAQLANRIFNIDYNNHSSEEMSLLFLNNLEIFFKQLGLKTKLKELDIDDKDFEVMANRATKNNSQNVGHYIELDKDAIVNILRLAL